MNEIDLPFLLMGLLGGLAIFLHGMDMMTSSLKAAAGQGLKNILKRLTVNRFAAVITGAGVTAVIQSSSVTTVLVVGFISAGVMTLQQSIGIIMGANIGTTITAQVIAFKVTKYALGLVFVGWFPLFFLKGDRWRQSFTALMGLGIVFLGMTLMSQATLPLRSYQPFINWMQGLENPLFGVMVGTVFTALVQSSSATTGIVIMLASQGLLPLEGGVAICMGANIGTCFTAFLASIGKSREVHQAVGVHILFNTIGVLIWLAFIPLIASWMVEISPKSNLTGLAKLAEETPRQIANAHTFFNVANTLLMIPFTGLFSTWIRRIVPDEDATQGKVLKTHLDRTLLKTPSFALDRVRMENVELGKRVSELMNMTREACLEGKDLSPKRVSELEEEIDLLQRGVVAYLAGISKHTSSQESNQKMGAYLQVANHFENMGDVLHDNVLSLAKGLRETQTRMSEETKEHFESLFRVVEKCLSEVILCLEEEDPHHARSVIAMKAEVMDEAFDISHRLDQRFAEPGVDRLRLYRLETDLVETIKRLFYLTKGAAKVMLGSDSQRN